MFTVHSDTGRCYGFGLLNPATQEVRWGAAEQCRSFKNMEATVQTLEALHGLPVVVTCNGVLDTVYCDGVNRGAWLYAERHDINLRVWETRGGAQ